MNEMGLGLKRVCISKRSVRASIKVTAMANEEERVLENQLEQQLKEQRDSLCALNDAVAFDPANPELLEVQKELVQAIKDAEEGLFHLKRARLLREADVVLNGFDDTTTEDVKAEPLDPVDVEPEPLEDQRYSVGSKCRFRYTDGRWYDGRIIMLEDIETAKISFLRPTSDNMLICKFFLQQRCRFGTSCRLSHGIDVPLSSLKKYVPTIWEQSLVGSTIWALSDDKGGIWRKAELGSWDDEHRMGEVVFRDDGSSAKLGIEAMTLSEYAQVSDEEESDFSSEQSDSSDYEDDGPQGLGFHESNNLKGGVQSDAAIFAKWENHTRGIASKMMASMGYREGMGLGASGQGILDPITAKVLPPKQSLDNAVRSDQREEGKDDSEQKKRSRGGKRKREKKFAEAARAARKKEESRPDVFSLINNQLAVHHETINGSLPKMQRHKGSAKDKKVSRRDIVAYDDEIKDLRIRVEKLEEMVKRNKNEKAVYEAATRKLNETRKDLAEAEAAQASASHEVSSREKEKRWLKF